MKRRDFLRNLVAFVALPTVLVKAIITKIPAPPLEKGPLVKGLGRNYYQLEKATETLTINDLATHDHGRCQYDENIREYVQIHSYTKEEFDELVRQQNKWLDVIPRGPYKPA